jgi:hypothetical protein
MTTLPPRYSWQVSGRQLERIVVEASSFIDPQGWRELLAARESAVCKIETGVVPNGVRRRTRSRVTNYHVLTDVLAGNVAAANVRFRFDYKRRPDL